MMIEKERHFRIKPSKLTEKADFKLQSYQFSKNPLSFIYQTTQKQDKASNFIQDEETENLERGFDSY